MSKLPNDTKPRSLDGPSLGNLAKSKSIVIESFAAFGLGGSTVVVRVENIGLLFLAEQEFMDE